MEERSCSPRPAGPGRTVSRSSRNSASTMEPSPPCSCLLPRPETVAEILSVLGPHNRREEEPGGAYDLCDEAIGFEAATHLVNELAAFPIPPLREHNDAPVVWDHIRVNLELSRRQWS